MSGDVRDTGRPSPWSTLGPVLYLTVAVGTVIFLSAPSHFVPCPHPSCGEIYESYVAARNLETFGWRWAGLQDEATNPQADAHPFLYIHHGDIGIYMSYVLGSIGMRSIGVQNLLSIIPFVGGLVFGYKLFSTLANDHRAGTVFLLLSCFDYLGTGIWALNMLRSWSYLCLFGGLWVLLWMERNSSVSLAVRVFYFLVSFLSLYVDYVFFSFLMLAALLFRPLVMGKIKPVKPWLTTTVPFAVAFLLRQTQVILGAGWHVWSFDFLYQVLNRTHMEKLYRGDWSADTTRFYEVNGILNPGLTPGASWQERLTSFVHTVGYFFNVSLLGGLANFHRSTAAMTTGLTFILLSMSVMVWGLHRRRGLSERSKPPGIVLMARASLLLTLCCLLEYAILPEYFLQWFPGFNLASVCVVSWGTIIFYSAAVSFFNRTAWGMILKIATAVKAAVLFASLLFHPLPSTDYAAALADVKGSTVVSNWIPSFVTAYTSEFSAALSDDALRRLPQRRRLDRKDFTLFVERDEWNPRYYKPAFLLLCITCGVTIYERTALEADRWKLAQELIGEGLPVADRGRSFVLFSLESLWSDGRSGH